MLVKMLYRNIYDIANKKRGEEFQILDHDCKKMAVIYNSGLAARIISDLSGEDIERVRRAIRILSTNRIIMQVNFGE